IGGPPAKRKWKPMKCRGATGSWKKTGSKSAPHRYFTSHEMRGASDSGVLGSGLEPQTLT
ncbi:hypothetical protein HAX54_035965, partial [Datura stramonium]|nr:hypothetical protein [Datura stramonium]